MGLVNYASDSDSDSAPTAPAPAPAPKSSNSNTKKPFQKVVDRSNPGKIVVNLPQATPSSADEPPTKRARTGDAGGGRFSGFNSFLPPPKNANKPKPAVPSGSARAKPGVNLRTSAAAAFSRDNDDLFGSEGGADGEASMPAPKKHDGPSIPEEQKPADEVKLVGKPMMFKPLSVSRNPKKKKATPAPPPKPAPALAERQSTTRFGASNAEPFAAAPSPPKKTSLFSLHTEEPTAPSGPSSGTYEPLFATQGPSLAPADAVDPYESTAPGPDASSLGTIANDLNLSAAERRELFGRNGGEGQMAKSVINFNMDKEYQHNETVRASGETQIHNPVRAIQGGKHSLKQLVSNVQNQKDALEDSFAKGKTNRKEASSKYGW